MRRHGKDPLPSDPILISGFGIIVKFADLFSLCLRGYWVG